jgi:hypothetical protein
VAAGSGIGNPMLVVSSHFEFGAEAMGAPRAA